MTIWIELVSFDKIANYIAGEATWAAGDTFSVCRMGNVSSHSNMYSTTLDWHRFRNVNGTHA